MIPAEWVGVAGTVAAWAALCAAMPEEPGYLFAGKTRLARRCSQAAVGVCFLALVAMGPP